MLVILLGISLVTNWAVLVLFIVVTRGRFLLGGSSLGLVLQLIEPLIAWRLIRQRWYKLGLCLYLVRGVWVVGVMVGYGMAGALNRGRIIVGSVMALLAVSTAFFLWWNQEYFDD